MSDDEDEVRSFSEQERELLSERLLLIRAHIAETSTLSANYSQDLICRWHRYLFGDIRSHAGKMRNEPGGADLVTFGGHVSCRSSELPKKMAEHIEEANRLWYREDSADPGNALRYALKIHADFIRIHPFDDGNGRIGRLILSFWCLKNKVPPPVFETVKDEYIQALNHYYVTRQGLDPLYTLAMRMLRNRINSSK